MARADADVRRCSRLAAARRTAEAADGGSGGARPRPGQSRRRGGCGDRGVSHVAPRVRGDRVRDVRRRFPIPRCRRYPGGRGRRRHAGVSPGTQPGAAKRTKSTASSLVELVVIVLVALGLALAIQAWIVKPYRIPSGSMEPTLAVGQRVLVDRIGTHFSKPHVGADHRLSSARRRRAAGVRAGPAHRQTGWRGMLGTDPERGHRRQLHQAHRRRPR